MLVVGLGNPEGYEGTRHNVGRDALLHCLKDRFAVDEHDFLNDKYLHAKYREIENHIYALPNTFMNMSGLATEALLSYFALPPQALLVLHDDLDLPFGSVRVSFDASAGGHNGVSSIIDKIGTSEFIRLRIGIAPEKFRPKGKEEVSKFVLSHFNKKEKEEMEKIFSLVCDVLFDTLQFGFEYSANKYNGI